MPKTKAPKKPVRSFRLSPEGIYQLQELAQWMGRSEGDVVEIALDRMYREEVRFGHRAIQERQSPENGYNVENNNEETS